MRAKSKTRVERDSKRERETEMKIEADTVRSYRNWSWPRTTKVALIPIKKL